MSHVVLYRKYRPQTFSDVVGQEHVVTTLKNALAAGKTSHAYLFSGPRGVGKTTVARLIAKTLNCETGAKKGEPCNTCDFCQSVAEGQALDIVEIDAASNRGIDEIRSLQEGVRFGASRGSHKVYLVDEVHMLTKEAFNAFLKTLEEPPEGIVFVLATTEVHKLPQTVISRTQRFDFRLIPLQIIEERLAKICAEEGVTADAEAVRVIAREADGSLRDAESILGQVLAGGVKKITIETLEQMLGIVSYTQLREFVDALIAGDRDTAFSLVDSYVEGGRDLKQFLHALNHYLRRVLRFAASPEAKEATKKEVSDDEFQTLVTQADSVSVQTLIRWIERFAEAYTTIERYPAPQLALELAIVEVLSDTDASHNDTENSPPSSPSGGDTKSVKQKTKKENKPAEKKAHKTNKSDTSPTQPTLATLREHWDTIARAITAYNRSLSAFVQATIPNEVSDEEVILTTKYPFHKERITDLNNRRAIEDAIEQTLGIRLRVQCVLEE